MYEEIYQNGIKVNELHYPEGIWTQGELIALERMHQKYSSNQDQGELPPTLYRWAFLRYLVEHGVYDDDMSVGGLTNEGGSGTLIGEHVG